MPSGKIYDRLLSLPLFQGLKHEDLSAIVETSRFDFRSYTAGETITQADNPCLHLYTMMSGTIAVTTISDNHSYRLTEVIPSPTIIEPERLYGLHQHYVRTFKAESNCQALLMEKQDVSRLVGEYFIFRINLLNVIATSSQRQQRQPWRTPPQTLAGRIVRFVEQHALRPAGSKKLYIKMERLAEELNDSRINISHALHELQSRGVVSLQRGIITVNSLEEALRNG